MPDYVLITAARNEGGYIERTLRSVTDQRQPPLRWVIVSDGSTDNTDALVAGYARRHPYIRLLRLEGRRRRTFGAKALAVRHGYQSLQRSGLEYEFVGNLDADVSFSRDYYRSLIEKFLKRPRLGVGGGIRYDDANGRFVAVNSAVNSVGGAFQFFRRACFEAVGGYQPLPYGGIDALAEITARMLGWRVQSFSDLVVYHHRLTGSATRGVLRKEINEGIKAYMLGYHPLFQLFRLAGRWNEPPIIVGGLLRLAGYTAVWLQRKPRSASEPVVRYLQREQLQRLRRRLRAPLPADRSSRHG